MRLEAELGHTHRSGSMWTKLERAVTARGGAFALAFIVLASFAFRLHVSHECSLWLDEAGTHVDVLKPWPQVLRGTSREHPPLMFVLVKAAIGLFGDDETGLRSVSLFFGCVLLVATYELCLEVGLGIWRALLVVATLALSPFFLRHCIEARQYAMLTAFITLATTRALRGPRRVRDLVGFALSALAAAWTQYFGLAYALALLATLAFGMAPVWKKIPAMGRVLRIALLLGLLALLGIVAGRALALGRFYDTGQVATKAGLALNADLLREMPVEFSFMIHYAWSVAIEPALAFLGLALLTWRLRGVARLLPLGIGLVPCAAALFIKAEHFIVARYLLPSAIFYHLGACVALFAAVDGVQRALARFAGARPFASLVGWLVLASLLITRLREYPTGFGAGLDDYRGLQRYFVSHLAKDTRLVAYFGSFGQLLLGREYRIGSPPIFLEKFRPVRGIDRYLVAEFHVQGAERRAELESLVERQFGLSPQAWRALPLVPLPHSIYQPAVSARLVQLPKDRVYRAPKERHRPP